MKVPFQIIAPDVILGTDTLIYSFVNLYGCKIGDRTKIGTFVEIQRGAIVGMDCKISSHSFICEGVEIGQRVFIGHHVVFINDKFPRAANLDRTMKVDQDWEIMSTVVEDDVSIGSGSTILCGIRIGSGSMIGAGSVVTKNIPPGELWVGNPARFLRKVDDR